MSELELPQPIAALCRDLGAAGGRALVVGGWVRDRLRGVASTDYDLEVYGIEPDSLRPLLAAHGSLHSVGEAFAVYKLKLNGADELPALDVALPRRESKSGSGHRGFVVSGDPTLSPAAAARRRDFTVNAIAFDPLSEELIDPYGGAADLERRLLRAVDATTFGDDSLRVLRAVQLAARLEFAIEPATAALCRTIALDDLPAERIWGEVEKWLLGSRQPSIGWQAALTLGVVDKLWPECAVLVGCEQELEWHPEGDVWTHTGLVLDAARPLAHELSPAKALALLLATIAHDFGKPATTRFENGRLRSPGHEAAGVAPAESFLARLNVHTVSGYDVRSQVKALVQHHLAPTHLWNSERSGAPVSDGALRRLARRVDPDLLHRLALADTRGRGSAPSSPAPDWLWGRMQALDVADGAPKPLLLGRHLLPLGISPGPEMGRLLAAVYELQLDGAVSNLEQALAAARRLGGTQTPVSGAPAAIDSTE